MKKCIYVVLTLIILAVSSAVYAETGADNISVILNGEVLEFDTPPCIINSRTMVPMRYIFEKLGAEVNWDNGVVNAVYNNKSINLEIGSDTAVIENNGETEVFPLDAPPCITDGRTLVPLRFIGESLDMKVDWNEAERTVYINNEKEITAEIDVRDYGVICLRLYPQYAPVTVENFIKLANSGFYNGLTFHRIIDGFVIQGGDPTGTGMGGSGEMIIGEFAQNGFTQNTLKHKRGVISMARSADRNSASSQFFITHKDSPHLDGAYAAFGEVISGIDVVDMIAGTETDEKDRPLKPVIINSINIIS